MKYHLSSLKKNHTHPFLSYAFIGAFLGAIIFLCIYGFAPLDGTNIAWILEGYDGSDVVQHYVGWVNFRYSDWQFPLSQANFMAYPSEQGVNISYMDSIPAVAVFFKLFEGLLPYPFQYMGLYTLLVFMLQGAGAALLLQLFIKNLPIVCVGTSLFCISPILLERAFHHSSLASHYFILFAMYLYFRWRRSGIYPKWMILWAGLSVGITPYFLPMVMIFVLLLCIENSITPTKKLLHRLLAAAGYFCANAFAALGVGYILGTIGNGYSPSRGGYGYFNMNLNAPINPKAVGNNTWSQFFPQRPQLDGQYDAFNYLGIGVMLLGLLGAFLLIIVWFQHRPFLKNVLAFLRKNIWLLLASLGLTCFAVSHSVCFSSHRLLQIPLPEFLKSLCGMFRASGRMFYPVYYLLFLFGLVACWYGLTQLTHRKWIAGIIITLLVVLQVYDLSGALIEKRHGSNWDEYDFFSPTQQLLELKEYEALVVVGPEGGDRYLLWLTSENALPTTTIDTNTSSPDFVPAQDLQTAQEQLILSGELNSAYVYATKDSSLASFWQQTFEDQATFSSWTYIRYHDDISVATPEKTYYFMIPFSK